MEFRALYLTPLGCAYTIINFMIITSLIQWWEIGINKGSSLTGDWWLCLISIAFVWAFHKCHLKSIMSTEGGQKQVFWLPHFTKFSRKKTMKRENALNEQTRKSKSIWLYLNKHTYMKVYFALKAITVGQFMKISTLKRLGSWFGPAVKLISKSDHRDRVKYGKISILEKLIVSMLHRGIIQFQQILLDPTISISAKTVVKTNIV